MSQHNDASYYLRRGAEARASAAKAVDRAICRIHLELADRCSELASLTAVSSERQFSGSVRPGK